MKHPVVALVSLAVLLAACQASQGERPGVHSTTHADRSLDIVSDQPLSPLQLESLRSMADRVPGDLPRVTVEREITPEEAVKVINACMTERGFTADEAGAVTLAPGQEQDYWTAAYVCHAQYPQEERFLQPLTAEQYTLRYEHWIDELLPCWAELGIYPTEAPPSLQAFLGDVHAWRPERSAEEDRLAWMESNGAGQEDLDSLCPPDPPLDLLFPPD